MENNKKITKKGMSKLVLLLLVSGLILIASASIFIVQNNLNEDSSKASGTCVPSCINGKSCVGSGYNYECKCVSPKEMCGDTCYTPGGTACGWCNDGTVEVCDDNDYTYGEWSACTPDGDGKGIQTRTATAPCDSSGCFTPKKERTCSLGDDEDGDGSSSGNNETNETDQATVVTSCQGGIQTTMNCYSESNCTVSDIITCPSGNCEGNICEDTNCKITLSNGQIINDLNSELQECRISYLHWTGPMLSEWKYHKTISKDSCGKTISSPSAEVFYYGWSCS